MKVFAISDLHLSLAAEKPMDIFGDGWIDHFDKVSADWRARVGEDDLVLLGGDISWGMYIEDAAPDYAAIAALPGKKIVGKGNHDLYWTAISKMRAAFPEFCFVQNDCVRCGGYLVAGTRGWTMPCDAADEHDTKVYARELIRLELSLTAAERMRTEGDKVIAMLHYPPFDAKYNDSEVTALIEKYRVDAVTYGHLHGKSVRATPKVEKRGIPYYLTSCDLVNNTLVEIF